MKLISFISRTFSNKNTKIFNLPDVSKDDKYFNYNGVEYSRAYAKWKCSNRKCKKTWESAYTWISFDSLRNNTELYDHPAGRVRDTTRENSIGKPFSGSKLNVNDYFQEECKACNSKINKIVWYDNLISSKADTIKPHRSDLCAKCKLDYPCQFAGVSSFKL